MCVWETYQLEIDNCITFFFYKQQVYWFTYKNGCNI